MIKRTRGARVRLAHHPDYCDLDGVKDYIHARKSLGRLIAVELFSGAGGLSCGLEQAGFSVAIAVDKDQQAIETHSSNFGGASLTADLTDPRVMEQIIQSVQGEKIDIVAGGPPCQSFSRAGENKIRNLVTYKNRDVVDHRSRLWETFMDFVEQLQPRAFVIENVPDLAFGKNSVEFKGLIDRIAMLGFEAHIRILKSSQYGVPQQRQRIFIIGLKSGGPYFWPEPEDNVTSLWEAIGDLPDVEGGDFTECRDYDGPHSEFQKSCRSDVPDTDISLVYDHITRAVRDDDLQQFRSMKQGDTYLKVPEALRRYRSDIFGDKYKRLEWDNVSRTITAHIAKDGYAYIHPEQDRTLTIREAARIQTFPDKFRFAGFRSSAFKQIGEAVPPRLGQHIGESLVVSLSSELSATHQRENSSISDRLVDWMNIQDESSLAAPWRASEDPWQFLLGHVVFGSKKQRYLQWVELREKWPTPHHFLDRYEHDVGSETFLEANVISELRDIAISLDAGTVDPISPSIAKSKLDLVHTICGLTSDPFPSAVSIRVSRRIYGDWASSDPTMGVNGRLYLVRATNHKRMGRAYSAILEIGDRFCKRMSPRCFECPVQIACTFGQSFIETAEKTGLYATDEVGMTE